MSNRMIRESLCTSESLSRVSAEAWRLFISMMTFADDYGRVDGRPAVIWGRCVPLIPKESADTVMKELKELADVGCIKLYEVDGKPYVYYPNWPKYQVIRNKMSRYPGPEEADSSVLQVADDCNQLNTIENNRVSKPNRNQTETKPKSYCAERSSDHSAPEAEAEDAVYRLVTNDGRHYEVTQTEVEKYTQLYPNVDVEQEYRNMIGWLESNKTKRKTLRGMPKFINAWLAREQNKGGKKPNAPVKPQIKDNDAPQIPKFRFYDE